ncbi:TM2 domain-containing protein [uncultured Bacteroides sp.]|uniref:TM2 domain-containing protein n=1 Tax=uncultured Bacteroides sp. TaxID=162156 RepID=UPI002AAC489D|nr:TM2 domain-containing protein [uncultured Bacteroides sp.]
MDSQKVDTFIITNGKYFPSDRIIALREMLLNADESKWLMIQPLRFKDPTIALIISLLAGSLGIDRFFIGDIVLGVVKLITFGGLGIWTITDFIFIMKAARTNNIQKIYAVL